MTPKTPDPVNSSAIKPIVPSVQDVKRRRATVLFTNASRDSGVPGRNQPDSRAGRSGPATASKGRSRPQQSLPEPTQTRIGMGARIRAVASGRRNPVFDPGSRVRRQPVYQIVVATEDRRVLIEDAARLEVFDLFR